MSMKKAVQHKAGLLFPCPEKLLCKYSLFRTLHIRSFGQCLEALRGCIFIELLDYLHQVIAAVSVFVDAGGIAVQFDVFVLCFAVQRF